MTYTHCNKRYGDFIASIEQDKFSSVYIARVYRLYKGDESRAYIEYENVFTSIANARRALARQEKRLAR